MCSLCGVLGAGPHWSETQGDRGRTGARGDALRERLHRVRVLNRALAPYGLRVEEWEETAYVLRAPTGETVLVDDVQGLAVEASRLARRPIDPLDPAYLERLV